MTTPRDDIAGLSERLRELEAAERAVASDMDMRPEDTANFAYAETVKEAATQLDSLLKERDALQARVKELEAELSRCGRQNCLGHRTDDCASWVREERLDEAKAERDVAIANWSEWKKLAEAGLARAIRAEQERDEAYERADYYAKRVEESLRRLAGPEKIAAANDREERK